MGSLCAPAQTTSTYAPNPQATQQYQDILARANTVASTPYQAYGGQGVAGMDPTQTAGIANVNQSAGTAQPYFGEAANYARTGASPVANISDQDIFRYQSPYQKSVIDATMANINETNNQQQNQLRGSVASRGALGGDRQAVLQAELARQQNLAGNQTLAGLQNQGYQSALAAAQSQQQNQQQNANRQFTGAQTLSNIGAGAQNAGIAGGVAQLGAGAVAQGNQQQQLDYARQQFMQQQAFPYQQTGWLAGVANPTAGALGGTQTTTPPAPSPFSQLAGLGLAGAMLIKDGGRVVPEMADGGSISPYDAAGIFGDVPGYIPRAPQLTMPASHNFGTSQSTPVATNPFGIPGGMQGLSALKGKFNGSAGDFGGSPESNPLLRPIGLPDFSHGGLVHAIHAIRHSIRSKSYAEGGAVDYSPLLNTLPMDRGSPEFARSPLSSLSSMPDVRFKVESDPHWTGHSFKGDVSVPVGDNGRVGLYGGHKTDRYAPQNYGGAFYSHQFAEGGDVGGGDDSLNPRNWLGFQVDNGAGGTFPLMKELEYPSQNEYNFMDAQAQQAPVMAYDDPGQQRQHPLSSYAPREQPQGSPYVGTPGGIASPPMVNESYPDKPQRSGLFNLTDDQRHGLLAAGLGMLGGSSPYAGVNIGAGGLKGLEAMSARKKQQLEEETKRMHADVEARRLAQSAEQFAQTFGQREAAQKEIIRQHNMPKIEKGMDEYGRPQFHLVDPVKGTINKLDPNNPTGEDTSIPAAARWTQGPLPQGVKAATPDPTIDPVTTPGRNETPQRNETFLTDLAAREPNAANLVRAMADGRLAIPTGGRINPFWQKIIQDTQEYDPSFDAANYRARAALRQKMKSGAYADNRTSINTAMSHLNGLADDVEKLPNTGWFPGILNPMIHAAKKNLKDEPFQELLGSVKTHRTGVADELAKLFKGTGASNLHDIQAWNDTFQEAKSPAELKSAIKAAYKMINGRIEAMGETYNAGMGTNIDPMKWLTPQSRKAYERFTGGDYLPTEKKQNLTAPAPGTIKNGYKFRGGDPGKQESWEKVQ